MKTICVDNGDVEVVEAVADVEVIGSGRALAPAMNVALAHHQFNLKKFFLRFRF